MEVEINIAGGTYEHRSRPLSAQATRNFWPQAQEDAATSQYILESFPGLKMFSAGAGADRGMFEHKGVPYKVTGTTLSSIDSAGTRTTLGTIPGGSRCVFDAIGDTIIIVSDGVAYTWNGSSVTTASDEDFETPQTVTVLNAQAIYDGDGARFGVSDAGAPLTINGLNYATAEGVADNLIRPYAYNQVVHMMCEKHMEGWWNSGVGNPPFDRLEGGLHQIGLAARYSVAHNKNFMYFLGSDRNVYRLSAGAPETGFTPRPLVREFSQFDTVSDAIGWCMNYQGQEFYVLKFPIENRTFAYPEGGQWFELSSSEYDNGPMAGRYKGNSAAYCYGKHLIADEDGNVLELDEETYTDNDDTIRRVRDSAPLHGALLGAPGRSITLTRLRILMETGVGEADTDPQIMVQFSTDGGRTFGTEIRGDVGEVGDFMTPVEWFGLNETGDSIIIRLVTSGAFYCSVHSAVAEVEIGM
jgi:hypothetical protein